MLLVGRHSVSCREVAVHGRDGELDSELWCTGNLYVFTRKGERHVRKGKGIRGI